MSPPRLTLAADGRLLRDVKFSLTYDGELLSGSDKHNRLPNKNRIRFSLCDQLAPVLMEGDFSRFGFDATTIPDAGRKLVGIGFVPILTRTMNASCGLAIKFMRSEQTGHIVHGGDMDNRLKTLFDALRMPENESEVLKELAPERYLQKDGLLCACLLEDDALITDLSVSTARLMTPLPRGHVRLVIDVEFRPSDFL